MKENKIDSLCEKQSGEQYRWKYIKQKLIGLGILALDVLLIYIASKGTTVEERDATAVLLTLPMGLGALFSMKIIIV